MLTAILVIIKIRSLTAVCPLPSTPFQSLKNAIIIGDSAGVTAALANNAPVNSVYTDAQNASPLIYLLANNHNSLSIAQSLVAAGADINYQDSNNRTALMFAAHKGFTDILIYLISLNGIKIDLQDIDGKTTLIYAIQFNSTATLVNGGFKGFLNVVGFKAGRSSRSAVGSMVTSLLNSGANPNIKDKTGSTALIYAVQVADSSIASTIITNNKTDPNIKNSNGDSALILAVVRGSADLVTAVLSSSKTDPNIQDANGNTALILAVQIGNSNLADIVLLNPDTDPNVKNFNGTTALIIAVQKGSSDLVSTILNDRDTDPNVQDSNGNTALTIATKQSEVSLINTLVINGADPSIVNNSGESAKTIAEDKNLSVNLLTTVTRRAFRGTTSEQTTSERN